MELIKATQLSFRKYGKVVNAPSDAPTSEAKEYKFWSDIADYEIEGETEIGICTVYRQPENILIGLERHINTPEILIPMDAPFILPVLRDGNDEQSPELFKVDIGEAVVIDNGVWHGPCLPYKVNQSSYFVIFKKGTPIDDVDKRNISPIHFEL